MPAKSTKAFERGGRVRILGPEGSSYCGTAGRLLDKTVPGHPWYPKNIRIPLYIVRADNGALLNLLLHEME